MRIKVISATYVLIVVMVTMRVRGKSKKIHDKIKKMKKSHMENIHPCDTAEKNTVIHTADGDIMCLRKGVKELEDQLERSGGFNRRYVAATLKEAKKDFKNLFKVYGQDYLNTKDWQRWRSFDNSRSSFSSSLKPVPLVPTKGATIEPHKNYHYGRKGRSLDSGGRSNDDLKILKRGLSGVNIQCLPGGRVTEKGVHLCPACQRCTELPKFMFPRYVNELTCSDSQNKTSSETGCYLTSKFQIGTCQQIKMTIDLLVHKNGKFAIEYQNETIKMYKEVYEPYTHEISTCCECMIFSSLVGK